MRLNVLTITVLIMLASMATACSKAAPEQSSNTATRTNNRNAQAAENVNKNSAGETSRDEVPVEVKAAFPDAQIVTLQHKNLTAKQISSVEKESGAKLADKDFHSFVAHDSSHKRIGAATVTDAEAPGGPVRLVVVYTNDGKISKVTSVKGSGDVVSPAFLDQFLGKSHDDAFHVGEDLRYDGSNKAAGEAVAHAVKRDVLAMHALYGKKHGH